MILLLAIDSLAYEDYFGMFKKAYPEWTGVPRTPNESVAVMMDTISKLTTAESGRFYSQNGDEVTWI